MDNNEFPITSKTILSNLVELLRHQNDQDVVKLLSSAISRIEYTDSGNFGDGDYYALFFDVPIEQYAHVEGNTEILEEKLLQKVKSIITETGNRYITQLKIKPLLKGDGHQVISSSRVESAHIWDEGCLKVFLSHVSAHKKKVVELKTQLKEFRVSAFVAHEDIEPSRKWQKEIELALHSMDAFVPLLTEDFHESNWTDQEVGIAIGLGSVIIPIRLGRDPYGFMGENQGLTGDLKKPKELAIEIVDVLLRNVLLGPLMRNTLVLALESSEGFIDSIQICERLSEVTGFTDDQIKRLQTALKNNDQVYNAFKVPGWINEIVQRHKKAAKK